MRSSRSPTDVGVSARQVFAAPVKATTPKRCFNRLCKQTTRKALKKPLPARALRRRHHDQPTPAPSGLAVLLPAHLPKTVSRADAGFSAPRRSDRDPEPFVRCGEGQCVQAPFPPRHFSPIRNLTSTFAASIRPLPPRFAGEHKDGTPSRPRGPLSRDEASSR